MSKDAKEFEGNLRILEINTFLLWASPFFVLGSTMNLASKGRRMGSVLGAPLAAFCSWYRWRNLSLYLLGDLIVRWIFHVYFCFIGMDLGSGLLSVLIGAPGQFFITELNGRGLKNNRLKVR